MFYMVSASVIPSGLKSALKLKVFKADAKFFNATQITLLNDIADIMIPATDSAGASDSHTAQVLDELMVSWATLDTQTQFSQFLSEFQSRAYTVYKKSYLNLSKAIRGDFLLELDNKAFENSETEFFTAYKRIKELIFHIHYSSPEANPHFFLIPGGYKGALNRDELAEINKRKYL